MPGRPQLYEEARRRLGPEDLDEELSRQALWEDQGKAQATLNERARLQAELEAWTAKEKDLEEISILQDIVKETGDPHDAAELVQRVDGLDKLLVQYEMERMLRGEADKENAIVYINAGAGGTEAQDWAEMLLRMYLMWSEKKGFQSQVVDILPGEEADEISLRA